MLSVIVLSVIMLSVFMLSVIMLSVIMLSVIMLSVVMLSAVMLSVVMLSVMAPKIQLTICLWKYTNVRFQFQYEKSKLNGFETDVNLKRTYWRSKTFVFVID